MDIIEKKCKCNFINVYLMEIKTVVQFRDRS